MATKKTTETEASTVEEKPKRTARRAKSVIESVEAPSDAATVKKVATRRSTAKKTTDSSDTALVVETDNKPAVKTAVKTAGKTKATAKKAAQKDIASEEDASTAKKITHTRAAKVSADSAESKKDSSAKEIETVAAGSSDAVEVADEGKAGQTRRPRRESVKIEKSEQTEGSGREDEADQSSQKQTQFNHHNGRHNGNNRHQRRQQRNREVEPSITREELEALKIAELRDRAAELEVDATGMKKPELVDAVYEASVRAEGFLDVEGILDILSDGYGFLRTSGYLPSETDCYVAGSLIKRNGLRKGDYIKGTTRPARDNEKFAAIQKIDSVNGIALEELASRPRFSDLTPVYPSERLVMEHGSNTLTARVIDLVAPIGKGQRGLIVSPPKAGKTTILKDIAAAISANNPEVHLMCLLIDERPEEVTDMQRSIKGEVVHSTFDMPAENHIAVSEMVIERAKRLVEQGKDVVILLDSITRLARAYNLAQPASGRVLSGGVDSTALYPPKRFLGAARNIEHGGSLTILASALIETGSKMDEVIFEEFKGTGNMELRLDRQLADRRIFPAIDPIASGTRKEELLLDSQMMPIIWAVRRILANMNNTERAMDMLLKSVKQTDDNQEFLLRMARKAQHGKTESLEL